MPTKITDNRLSHGAFLKYLDNLMDGYGFKLGLGMVFQVSMKFGFLKFENITVYHDTDVRLKNRCVHTIAASNQIPYRLDIYELSNSKSGSSERASPDRG